jgi:hypothetical protein
VRYPDGTVPNAGIPYGESMHNMLTLSMVLSIVIGICLYVAARHGRILWLKVWSIGLIGCSVLYLVGDRMGIL